jgi:salicylate 5-hydroxylase small subunit
VTVVEQDRMALLFELQTLYADYCACIDEGRYGDWPDFFVEECTYKVIPRENYDRGLPLATLAFESRGMLKDRAFGITQTLFHAPYYQRHIVSGIRINGVDADAIRAEANYLVIRTKQNEPSEVFNAGRYVDVVVREHGTLKFRQRCCVFDSELIPNSIIYPI